MSTRERAEPLDLEIGVEAVDEGGRIARNRREHLPSRHSARTSMTPPGMSSLKRVSGSCIGDHAGLEQHRGDADRVGAGHRRIFGRLHDDGAGVAIVARRRHQQIDVAGDAAARLADQQPADVVVIALHRDHLVEHRAPAGGSTPPTMTSPTSPSAWQPTTEMMRFDRKISSLWTPGECAMAPSSR